MTDIAVAETFRLADVFGKAVSIYSRRFVPFITLTVITSISDYIALWAIGIARLNLASGLDLAPLATVSLAGGAVMYGVVQTAAGHFRWLTQFKSPWAVFCQCSASRFAPPALLVSGLANRAGDHLGPHVLCRHAGLRSRTGRCFRKHAAAS
jgi:hypothetical protein